MLDLIRRKQKTTIVKVVFWTIIAAFIGTIFLVWGKGTDPQGRQTAAAEVNGEPISFDDFRSAHSNLYNLYRSLYGQAFTPELERQLGLTRQAINMLIDQALLRQHAGTLGVRVSRDELVASIAEIEAFQQEGQFSKQRYLEVLAYQRMTPEQFEALQENQLLADRVRWQLRSAITVSDADVAEAYRVEQEKINLQFVRFAPEAFLAQADVADAEVARAYAERGEQFRQPPRARLDYVQLDSGTLQGEVAIDETALERYYRRQIGRYSVPEQVRVAHILLAVPEDASDAEREEKRALAESLRQRAAAEPFAELAQRHSDDKATAGKGGDLGLFPRGVMVAAFEEAAFALAPGEISAPVETPYGYHVLQGIEHVEAGVKSLESVRPEVEEGLRAELAQQLAYEKALDAYNMNRKGAGLVGAAQQLGLAPLTTELFSQQQPLAVFGDQPELQRLAFEAEVGSLLPPQRVGGAVYLCQVAERLPSEIPPLEQVQEALRQILRRERATELARQAGEKALQAAREGADLQQVLPAGAKLEETGLFSRSLGDFVPKIGQQAQLAEAAFRLTPEQPLAAELYAQADQYYLVRLKQLEAADPTRLSAEEAERLRAQVLTRRQEEAVSQTLEQLRQSATIVIADAIVRAIQQGE